MKYYYLYMSAVELFLFIKTLPEVTVREIVKNLDHNTLYDLSLIDSNEHGPRMARYIIKQRIARVTTDDLYYWITYDIIKNPDLILKLRMEAARVRRIRPDIPPIRRPYRDNPISRDLDLMEAIYFLNDYQLFDDEDLQYMEVEHLESQYPGDDDRGLSISRDNGQIHTIEVNTNTWYVNGVWYRLVGERRQDLYENGHGPELDDDDDDRIPYIEYNDQTRLNLTVDAPNTIYYDTEPSYNIIEMRFDPPRSDSAILMRSGGIGELYIIYDNLTEFRGRYDDNFQLIGNATRINHDNDVYNDGVWENG
jgi:hypothetical protein